MILCECGEFIENAFFKCYINTSSNPSTGTIGHRNCGLVFNFIDEKPPKIYSSRKELKIQAARFAKKNMPTEYIPQFLLEVERLKTHGNMQDVQILHDAYQKIHKIWNEKQKYCLCHQCGVSAESSR